MVCVGLGSAILPGLSGTTGKIFGLETMTTAFTAMAVIALIFHELARFSRADRPTLIRASD